MDGWRSCGMEQPGLLLETVQEARVEISRKPGGGREEGGWGEGCGEAAGG